MIPSPMLSDDDGLAAHLEWLGALHDDRPAARPAATPYSGQAAPGAWQAPGEDDASGGEQGRS